MKSKSNEIKDENEAMRDSGEQKGILNISYTLQYFVSPPSHSLISSNEEFINERDDDDNNDDDSSQMQLRWNKKFSKRTERERGRKTNSRQHGRGKKQHNSDLKGDRLWAKRNVKSRAMFRARQVRKPQTQNNI